MLSNLIAIESKFYNINPLQFPAWISSGKWSNRERMEEEIMSIATNEMIKHDATGEFFDLAPTLKDYRKQFEPVDFTDLDIEEDTTHKLFFRLCMMLVMFIIVFSGTIWFITDNLAERDRDAETIDEPIEDIRPRGQAYDFVAEPRQLAEL